jgi:hypothetical protein
MKKANLSPLPKRNSLTKEVSNSPTKYPKPHESLAPLDSNVITPIHAIVDESPSQSSKFRYHSNVSVSDLTREELREIKDTFKALHRKIYENNTGTILREDLVEYNALKVIIKSIFYITRLANGT